MSEWVRENWREKRERERDRERQDRDRRNEIYKEGVRDRNRGRKLKFNCNKELMYASFVNKDDHYSIYE